MKNIVEIKSMKDLSCYPKMGKVSPCYQLWPSCTCRLTRFARNDGVNNVLIYQSTNKKTVNEK